MNNFYKDIMLPKDWLDEIKKSSSLDNLIRPMNFVKKELSKNKQLCPETNLIFKAFEYCSFISTKVVIFGQDPYFQKGVANGLAFSVKKNQPIPASLRNIYKEIKDDIGFLSKEDGCLKTWAKQGVLLLNSSLTVEASKPASHSNIGWDKFMLDLVNILNKKTNIVFILWGNHASKYIEHINEKNSLILSAPHPSPLSAYHGFFGSQHFSKCNNYLKKNNLKEIKW